MHQKAVWIKMKRLGLEGIIMMVPEGDCLALNKSIFCCLCPCVAFDCHLERGWFVRCDESVD